ncbi:paralemmin-3 [Polypterus senegalus]|uniref:paralemmin-3 n=1 Tax=Polypterus senegalus TaxID=55291 RepID=UPI0019669EAF|nr:paralemmin-3 [Polypterus senegalus]
MEETELYKQRLLAIAEKRRIQEEQDQARRQMEEERLRVQQMKRKSLRDQWLMEGPSPSFDSSGPRSPPWGSPVQQFEEQLNKLQTDADAAAEQKVHHLKQDAVGNSFIPTVNEEIVLLQTNTSSVTEDLTAATSSQSAVQMVPEALQNGQTVDSPECVATEGAVEKSLQTLSTSVISALPLVSHDAEWKADDAHGQEGPAIETVLEKVEPLPRELVDAEDFKSEIPCDETPNLPAELQENISGNGVPVEECVFAMRVQVSENGLREDSQNGPEAHISEGVLVHTTQECEEEDHRLAANGSPSDAEDPEGDVAATAVDVGEQKSQAEGEKQEICTEDQSEGTNGELSSVGCAEEESEEQVGAMMRAERVVITEDGEEHPLGSTVEILEPINHTAECAQQVASNIEMCAEELSGDLQPDHYGEIPESTDPSAVVLDSLPDWPSPATSSPVSNDSDIPANDTTEADVAAPLREQVEKSELRPLLLNESDPHVPVKAPSTPSYQEASTVLLQSSASPPCSSFGEEHPSVSMKASEPPASSRDVESLSPVRPKQKTCQCCSVM